MVASNPNQKDLNLDGQQAAGDVTKAWTQQFGSNAWDEARALTTDSDGSIYIAGITGGDLNEQSNNGFYDAFLSKYDADGIKSWTKLLGTSVWDEATSLTTGSDGSIYIAGITNGDLDGLNNRADSDGFLSKYDPDGNKDWTQLLGGTSQVGPTALTTGSDGSIYIAGWTDGSLDGQRNSGGHDAFLTKYDAEGTKKWTQLLGTTSNEYARALTTGSDGSIYIAGSTNGDLDGKTNSGNSDAFLIKYNNDGTKDWTQLLGSTASDYGNALTTGSDGSIYIAGRTKGDLDGKTNSGNDDAFLTKYNADGTKDWTQLLGTTEGEYAHALTTGKDGSIYIAGHTEGGLEGQSHNGKSDSFLSKYDANGNQEWTQQFGSNAWDEARALTTDSDGSIYIAGYTEGELDGQSNSGGFDAFLTKFIDHSISINDESNEPNIIKLGDGDVFLRGQSLYKIVDGPSWTQAEANAVKLGGNLVTINDQEENDLVLDQLRNYVDSDNRGGYWIGYYSPDLTGDFVWSSGEVSQYENWWPGQGEVTDYTSTGLAEGPYVHVIGPNGDDVGIGENHDGGKWNDFPDNPAQDISWGSQYEMNIGVAEIPIIRRNDSAYAIVEGPTWEEAEANAQKLGGNLVSINEAAENEWLVSRFKDKDLTYFPAGSIDEDIYWMGLTLEDGNWNWSSGDNISFINWGNKAPFGNGDKGQIILEADPNVSNVWTDTAGKWNDQYSSNAISGGYGHYGIAEINFPIYSITTSTESLEEGETLNTTVSTTNINLGTELHWSISGDGINESDFKLGELSGSGQTDADGKFSFSHTIRNDQTKEGPENLEIKLFTDALRTKQVGNTASVEIKDTSMSTNYVRRGDSAYVIVDGPRWTEAEAEAQKIGGHLTSIESIEENSFILNSFKEYIDTENRAGLWIGLNSDNPSREWQWSSGEDVTFTNWFTDRPHSDTYKDKAPDYYEVWYPEQYVHMHGHNASQTIFGNEQAGTWNDLTDLFDSWYGVDPEMNIGIAEIPLARSNQNIANQWAPNPQATADSDLELGYSLHSINGTDTQTDLKQLAVLGDSVDWQDTYRLDITAKSLAEGYDLETADITINFDPYLFNEIKASDITIGGQLPIANAVRIDNDVGKIRIAAASLGDLDPGDLYGNHLADAGSRIGGDGGVVASIELDFNEFRLDTLTQNSNGKILDPSTPLFFGLSANQDETVFSKALNDGSGFVNRDIKSLRDLGGDLAVEGTKVTLYEATINLEEQGDGLILSSDLDIGSYNSKQTNLVRSGDTITATSEWTNVGNIKATDIAITGVANDNASLTSSGFYISSPDDSQTSTNLESGSFVDGAFVQAGQETAQLVADIEITGAAGNVVDLSQGILSLQATGSDVFENQKGSKNLITFQGDLNYDGRVSMKDLAYLNAGAARQQQASEDPDAVDANNDGFVDASVARGVDANFDGQISMADLAVLDADWGQSLHQAANGTESSFTGSDQISWDQLDSQGLTGEATWDNQAFKDQNAVEAGNDFVESLESPAAVGVIGADGNETANDGGIAGDYFQDPLTG
ncbi:SBBP repeat-containing protein [Prochlorococcus sp. MIT 1201]|uniref:SBBP repeat-containing protein n=1 Tax=Prochlorococcus sp. MIT 1201 TaxID=3082535 RepID=UPI0039A52840